MSYQVKTYTETFQFSCRPRCKSWSVLTAENDAMLNLKLFASKTEKFLKSCCKTVANLLKIILVSILNRIRTTELT